MAFVEDLDAFFQEADFAVGAIYTPTAGGPRTVVGIFDGEYHEVLDMEGSAPAFTCKASDVPSVAHGDAIVVNGDSYKIVNVRPDGTGVVTLRLQLQ